MLKEIWIYRVVFPNGESAYEMKNNPLSEGTASVAVGLTGVMKPSTSWLAEVIQTEVRNKKDGLAIHVQPPYNLEIPKGLPPRLCLPLSEEEIKEIFPLLSYRR